MRMKPTGCCGAVSYTHLDVYKRQALRPSSDMVGLEHAFNLATRENEEWSPSEEKLSLIHI